MIRHIKLNGRDIEYNLNRKSVKRINMTITPQGVRVSAPKIVKIKDIEEFIHKNADFVLKHLDKYEKMKENLSVPNNYTTGEKIRYFGDFKELVVKESAENSVELTDEKIILSVTDTNSLELKKAVIDWWHKALCQDVITAICKEYYPKFEKLGIKFPQVKFRKMVSRWGSCRPMGCSVTFNTHLAEVPIQCIEYVVVHEFTHFIHANHSRAFYEQVEKFMPDYKKREQILKALEPEVIKR